MSNLSHPIACIILPTYNEADNIQTIVPALFEAAQSVATHNIKIIVVDDQSPDGTAARVKGLMALYPQLHLISGRKRGLGDAYKRGITYAVRAFKPEYLIQMDADWQHAPEDMPKLIAAGEGQKDVVIGSRFVSGASTPGFPLSRRLMSRLGHFLFRIFSGIDGITDVTSGFRCIRADFISESSLDQIGLRGYAFQSALLFQLIRQGATVYEIPITFPNRRLGQSKLAIRDKLEFLSSLIRLRWG